MLRLLNLILLRIIHVYIICIIWIEQAYACGDPSFCFNAMHMTDSLLRLNNKVINILHESMTAFYFGINYMM